MKTSNKKWFKLVCQTLLLSVLIAWGLNSPRANAAPARYNGPASGDDSAVAMAVDNFGNIYVVGKSWGGIGTGYNYLTVKYSANGTQRWAVAYNGPGCSDDVPSAITVDPFGQVYVTGSSRNAHGDFDYATIKYSTTGTQLWCKRYDGQGRADKFGRGDDLAVALALDAAGNVYVTGSSEGRYSYWDYATLKYAAADGHELWEGDVPWDAARRFDASIQDRAVALGVDDAGNAYVTGYSHGGGTGYDFVTLRYAAADGDEVWAEPARFDGENGLDQPAALKVRGSFFYITGTSWRAGHQDFKTLKYDTNGNLQWETGALMGEGAYPRAMAIDSLGRIYVTGWYQSGNFMSNYATVRYSPAGSRTGIWLYDATFERAEGYPDAAQAIAVDNADNVFVTGYSRSLNDQGLDYVTMKLAEISNMGNVWRHRFSSNGNADDTAVAVAVDANGNVYVTGSSTLPGQGKDIVTLKYSPDGAVLW